MCGVLHQLGIEPRVVGADLLGLHRPVAHRYEAQIALRQQLERPGQREDPLRSILSRLRPAEVEGGVKRLLPVDQPQRAPVVLLPPSFSEEQRVTGAAEATRAGEAERYILKGVLCWTCPACGEYMSQKLRNHLPGLFAYPVGHRGESLAMLESKAPGRGLHRHPLDKINPRLFSRRVQQLHDLPCLGQFLEPCPVPDLSQPTEGLQV